MSDPEFVDLSPIVLELTEPAGTGATNFAAQSGSVVFQDAPGSSVTAVAASPDVSWSRSTAISQSLVNQLTTNDMRSAPALTLSTGEGSDGQGHLTWTFDPGSASIDTLGTGEQITLSYSLSLSDSSGATSQTSRLLIVHINGSDELVAGTDQPETLQGSGIADDLYGYGGADTLTANSGNDNAYGGDGADSIDGGSGSDRLDGGDGDDTLIGGYGDDTLVGGAGNDRLDGGSGTDTAVFADAWSTYTITKTSAGYTLVHGSETDQVTGVERFVFAGSPAVAASAITNHAPAAADDAATANAHGMANGNVVTNDSDPDAALGDSLTVVGIRAGAEAAGGALTAVSGATHVQGSYGELTIGSDGSFTYQQNPDLGLTGAASDLFTYRISDAKGSNDLAQINIAIAPPPADTPPTATADQLDAVENVAKTYAASELLGNDSDPDGDPLSLASVTNGTGGTVALNPDGTVTFTPASDFTGPASFDYSITDGRGGSASATASVQVVAANSPPTGTASAVLPDGVENTPYQVTPAQLLQGFSDPDGDPLAVSGLQASDGTVARNSDGSFTITPSQDHVGPITLDYEVVDGQGGSADASLSYTLDAESNAASAVVYNSDTGELIVRGTAAAAAAIELMSGTTSLGAGQAAADGSFRLETNVRLPAGQNALNLRITDADGTHSDAGLTVQAQDTAGDAWYNQMLDTGARGVAIGDSLFEYNNRSPQYSTPGVIESTQGFLNWATVQDPRWDFTTWASTDPNDPNGLIGGNAGMAGAHVLNTSPNFIVPDIWSARDEPAARNADFVIIDGGTNDLNSNVDGAQVEASIQQLVDYELSEQRYVVVSTIPPRILATDPDVPSSGWPPGDPRWERLDEVNAWIRNTYGPGQVHGVVLADVAAAVASPDADGIQPQYTRDGTHFSALGAFTASSVYSDAIAQFVKPGVPASYDAPSLLALEKQTGTHDVVGDAVSGTLPGDFTLLRGSSLGNWTASAQTVATDHGNDVTLTFQGGAPTGVDYFDLRLGTDGGQFSIGPEADWVRLYAKVDVDAWAGWQGLSIEIDTGDGQTSQALRPLSGAQGNMPEGWDGWLVTDPILVPQGVGTITPHLQVIVGDASGSGSLTIDSFDLRVVDDPGPAWNYSPQIIRGGSGDDAIAGNDLQNYLYGYGGADTLQGSNGDDVLSGGPGNDLLTGGAGIDTAVFDGSRADHRVDDLGDGAFEVTYTGSDPSLSGSDTLQGVEKISFASGESIDLTAGRAIAISAVDLAAYSAPGTVVGSLSETLNGDDLGSVSWRLEDDASGRFALSGSNLVAGPVRVDDTVSPTETVVLVGTAPDGLEVRTTITVAVDPLPDRTISGTDAADTLDGSNGKDSISGGGGDDLIFPHGRPDSIDGGDGFDRISYQNDVAMGGTDGIVLAVTGTGSGTVTDGWGDNDSFVNIEAAIGSSAADRFTGKAGVPMTFYGLAGNDYFFGGSGGSSSTVSYALDAAAADEHGAFGTAGVTVDLQAGYATDGYGDRDQLVSIPYVIGTGQDDWINGSTAANQLQGGGGDDWLSGAGGNDTLSGGDGNDTLLGGLGANVLDGGTGIDTADFSDATGAVTASLAKTGSQTVFSTAKDSLVSIENLAGSSFNDVLTGDGNDNGISGGDGKDTLTGGAGNDTLDGGRGADQLSGGLGDDHYVVDDPGDLVVEAADAGNDVVATSLGSYTLTANVENLTRLGDGDFTGTGNALGNRISGGNGNDSLSGGDGNDVLAGGTGNDTLDGGNGTDTALFAGNWTDYQISATSGGYSLTHGSQTISVVNVEQFVFGDSAPIAASDSVDHAPAASDQSILADQQGAAQGNLLDGVTDADIALGDHLSVLAMQPEGAAQPTSVDDATAIVGTYGVLTIGSDGAYSYQVDDNDPDTRALQGAADDVFTYQVVDAKGLTGQAQLTIEVPAPASAGNIAPVAGDDTLSGTEDSRAIFTPDQLLANDHDDNHDPLHLASVQSIAGGTVSLGGDGNVVFTPDANFNGPARFSYAVEDGRGGSATATVTVDVAPVNDPATISGDLQGAVTEDGTMTATGHLQVSDVDAGENQLALPADLDGSYGSFAFDLDDGSWTYTLANSSPAVQDLGAGQTVHDTLSVSSKDGTATVVLDVTITGAAEPVTTIQGDAGDNSLTGTAGDDAIQGADGNDLLSGLQGHDTLDGGNGNDTVSYAWTSAAVTANLANGTATVGQSIAIDQLTSIENLSGGSGNDSLTGDDGPNLIDGRAGADVMTGGNGDDSYIVDDPGDRVIETAAGGMDSVFTGLSSYTAPSGVEALTYTGTGAFAGTGNELGNLLTGGGGADRLTGNAGNDTLVGGNGADSLLGGDGNDRLIGGAGADRLTGGNGADIFVFTNLDDSTAAAAGRDLITDFLRSQGDLIDLSGIDADTRSVGDQAFTLVSAFSGMAGQLTASDLGNGIYAVRGDVDGDARADFSLYVTSGTAPASDWFIL